MKFLCLPLASSLAGSLRPLDETPVDADLLSEYFSVVHRFLGRERLLVGLVLDECVALEEASSTVEI